MEVLRQVVPVVPMVDLVAQVVDGAAAEEVAAVVVVCLIIAQKS